MVEILAAISGFFAGASLLVYVCIFLGKIVEVALGTLRIVLINRGERAIGAFMALVEITLWLVIAGSVLSNYQEDPWKMLAYGLAYALGNYAGSWLEEKLAFGLCSIQCVVMDSETADKISDALRARGFGVSELRVQGKDDSDRFMLLSTLRRKLSHEATDIIQSVAPNAVITISDVKSQRGGYIGRVTGNKGRKSK